jgi:hypothetical protein
MCAEKQTEIDRILRGYRGDKTNWRKKEKKYWIVIVVQFALLLLITAFGQDGIKLAMEFARDIIK